MELYDYQQDAIGQVRGAYAAGRTAPLLVLPTGGGKTVCFTYMARRAADKGVPTLLLAHRKELVLQISAALKCWDVEHGLIAPWAKPTSHGVQVAMAQTLVKRLPLDKAGRLKFGLVIIDEAHHATKDSTWGKILDHNAGGKILGVSATPCRLDGQGLGVHADGFFDSIIVGPSVTELIQRGKLCQPVIYQPDIVMDDAKIKRRDGDYSSKDLAAATGPEFTLASIEYYRNHLAGAPSIAFACTTKHAGEIAQAYKDAGYSAAVLTGKTPDKERTDMIRDLALGRLNLLTSCDVINEGTDIPAVVGAILLRKTMSFPLAMQQIGRALRTMKGKERAVILDMVGNTLAHGDPEQPVTWTLDGVEKGQSSPGLVCYGCRAIVPYGAIACPGCGKAMRGESSGDAAQGEQMALPLQQSVNLIELTPARREQLRAEKRAWMESALPRCNSLQDFEAVANVMGFKNPRWPESQMNRKERFSGLA